MLWGGIAAEFLVALLDQLSSWDIVNGSWLDVEGGRLQWCSRMDLDQQPDPNRPRSAPPVLAANDEIG